MKADHLALLVEEPSMEAFLRGLLPRVLPSGCTYEIHSFQGKSDLLGKLEARLRGYASWLPATWRVAVIVDRDDDDCLELKRRLEATARRSNLRTRTDAGEKPWQVVLRIAVEELEAWYFGDWDAVLSEYPRLPVALPKRQGYRDPDAIVGGTWEAFERVLKKHGYAEQGLAKIDAARRLGSKVDPSRQRSASFRTLVTALQEATT